MSGDGLTLVVLAAGLGSRYGGLKQLEAVGPGGETLMDYSVYDASVAGFGRVVFVIRPEMETAFRVFAQGRYGERVSVTTAHQRLDDIPSGFVVPVGRVKPWGTAHATLAAEAAVAEPFVVVNADDFYGASAFAAAAAFLREPPGTPPVWALVGYRLRDTLSEAGGVSRAVCGTDTGGRLTTIEEVHEIAARGPDFTGLAEGRTLLLKGDEPVSMNIWAFTPEVFGLLRRGFVTFLHRPDLEKSEYLLPTHVQEAIRSGEARVQVLPAGSVWHGITHPADLPRVQAEMRRLHREGHYPPTLWT